MKKILIISPHPDDEILGCGGTLINEKEKDNKIFWIIITKMSKRLGYNKIEIQNRDKEIVNIKDKLKINRVEKYNFDTGSLNKSNLTNLIQMLKVSINKIKPEKIFVPYIYDAHSDHFFLTYAINSISKSFRFSFIRKIMMYETLSETNFNFTQRPFKANVYHDISKNINHKLALAKIYKTEIKKHPFPRSLSAIKSLAKIRGSESGFKYAEAFELLFEKNDYI